MMEECSEALRWLGVIGLWRGSFRTESMCYNNKLIWLYQEHYKNNLSEIAYRKLTLRFSYALFQIYIIY